MLHSFAYILFCLLLGITIIVWLTAKYKVPAFFALLLACFVIGLCIGMPVGDIIGTVKTGFGNIMGSLGLLIILGTTLGLILEHTGSTTVMAEWILKRTGSRSAPAAMSITGFIAGLPIFCDSGFIVLSGLNRSVSKRTSAGVPVMAVSLATGLYSVHCLVPPHPGVSAAAGMIVAEIGKLVLYGMIVAIPAAIAGYVWASYAGRKIQIDPASEIEEISPDTKILPSVWASFLPVIVPVGLIAIKSILSITHESTGVMPHIFVTAGDPIIALSVGIVLAFAAGREWKRNAITSILQDAVEKAGGILVIIAAGGAFGAILSAAKIGDHLSNALPLASLGIFFPFLLSFLLKTAQGSSTVAIITASSIVQPLLPVLGLASGAGPLLCVLSMGAGSMMISHANDAYFWVIAKFSGLDMRTMLKVYTLATVCMGITAFLSVYLLSLLLQH